MRLAVSDRNGVLLGETDITGASFEVDADRCFYNLDELRVPISRHGVQAYAALTDTLGNVLHVAAAIGENEVWPGDTTVVFRGRLRVEMRVIAAAAERLERPVAALAEPVARIGWVRRLTGW